MSSVVRWLIAAAVAVAVVVGVVAAALLVPGGSQRSGDSQSSGVRQRMADRAATVRFAGGPVRGVLYVQVGRDPNYDDAYRLSGDPSRARRLTTNGRLSTISAQPGRVVVADARGSGSDRAETLDLAAKGDALPGRLIDPAGQTPVLSRSGKVAYVVPQYGPNGSDAGTSLFVAPYEGGPKRLRYRARTDLGSPTWLPGDRLAVISDPDTPKAKVVLDPGTPRQRAVDPPFSGAYGLQASAAGELYVANARRLALLTRTGKLRGAPIDHQPVGWALDGRRVLVVDGRDLGLLDPDSGRVKPLLHTDGPTIGGVSWVER